MAARSHHHELNPEPRATRMRRTLFLSVSVAMTLVFVSTGTQAASAQRGLAIARSHCASCHSIDRHSESPLQIAPPFRELIKRYEPESLEEALGEGIATGHPSMPEFRLEPDQIGDFIAFLKSLR